MELRILPLIICSTLLCVFHSRCDDLTTASTLSTTLNTTVLPIINTTALTPDELCRTKSTCDECVAVEGAKCYFCHNNATNNYGCRLYPASKVFPTDDCPLSEARWGVCWVNFEALIISMSVIAGVLLIAIITACYCCCCRSKSSATVDRTTMKWERETREREQRHADRRAEREAKMDAIRQKYGLNRETSSYNRMA